MQVLSGRPASYHLNLEKVTVLILLLWKNYVAEFVKFKSSPKKTIIKVRSLGSFQWNICPISRPKYLGYLLSRCHLTVFYLQLNLRTKHLLFIPSVQNSDGPGIPRKAFAVIFPWYSISIFLAKFTLGIKAQINSILHIEAFWIDILPLLDLA